MSFASSKRPPLGGRLEEEGAKFGGEQGGVAADGRAHFVCIWRKLERCSERRSSCLESSTSAPMESR